MHPLKVLLVEDNADDADLLCEMLAEVSTARFDLFLVERLTSALQRLDRERFDVVRLDLSLPDSQGLDTFAAVCEKTKDIPLIVLTGLQDENLAMTLVHEGAQDYLLKGEVDGRLLARSIRYAVERKNVERQLKKSMEAAEAANRAKTEFLAVMSHEIRNPLNAILGMAEALAETDTTPAQQRFVDVFRNAGETLLGLISDTVDLAKIESSHTELDQIAFNLDGVVHDAIDLASPGAERKGLRLVFHIMPGVPEVIAGDSHRLKQVLMNLIGNAVKFSDSGEILLLVENANSQQTLATDDTNADPATVLLRFWVVDPGIGIPADKLEAIFAPYIQLDGFPRRNREGAGLGLAICRKLVSLMGGDLQVESTVGEGSTFHFTARFGCDAAWTNSEAVAALPKPDLPILSVHSGSRRSAGIPQLLSDAGYSVTQIEWAEVEILGSTRSSSDGQVYALVLLSTAFDDIALMMVPPDSCLSSGLRAHPVESYFVRPVAQSELLRCIAGMHHRAGARAQDAAIPARSLEPERSSPLRILVVEDDPENCLVILSHLNKTPHQIEIAGDGNEAVGRFKSEDFDLVLMDMQMPVMDGYAATRAIRNWERKNGLVPTPVVALTACATTEEMHQSLEAGCTAHLTKPVSKAKLLECIAKTMGMHPSTPGRRKASPAKQESAPEAPVMTYGNLDLEDLTPTYLANRRSDVDTIRATLQQKDFDSIRTLGHRMKGHGGSYGFIAISEIGGNIEKAAKEQDAENIEKCLDALTQYINHEDTIHGRS